MQADLPARAKALFDRYKEFPEAGRLGADYVIRGDAYVAFLDTRAMMEREVLPALYELAKVQEKG